MFELIITMFRKLNQITRFKWKNPVNIFFFFPSVFHIKQQYNAFKNVTLITNEISVLSSYAELVFPEIVPYKIAYSI